MLYLDWMGLILFSLSFILFYFIWIVLYVHHQTIESVIHTVHYSYLLHPYPLITNFFLQSIYSFYSSIYLSFCLFIFLFFSYSFLTRFLLISSFVFSFQAFPEADLRITLAGHSGMEIENIRELVAATEKFKLQ